MKKNFNLKIINKKRLAEQIGHIPHLGKLHKEVGNNICVWGFLKPHPANFWIKKENLHLPNGLIMVAFQILFNGDGYYYLCWER